MKAMICEMCGGNDIIKDEGLYVCQSCGAKYSPNDAKNLLKDIKVTINNSERIESLYASARSAAKSGNDNVAQKLYNELLMEDPSNWEPIFYTSYYEVANCRVIDMISRTNSFSNSLDDVVLRIFTSVEKNSQIAIVAEVTFRVNIIVEQIANASINLYNNSSITGLNETSRELSNRIVSAANVAFHLGDLISRFREAYKDFHPLIVTAYTAGINTLNRVTVITDERIRLLIRNYLPKIEKYEPSFKTSETYKLANSKIRGACYIATAVYKSYDCPEVWTLRRYRDYYLARTCFGRAFIKFYYLISPLLVRKYGNKAWFQKTWRRFLDDKVRNLQKKGVANTPYVDIDLLRYK